MAKISGILTDGTGQIINDCTIELYAKKTTGKVLAQTQAFTVWSDGKYSMNVLPCEYEVGLIINGFPKKRLGIINVYSDSLDGTLNDYLINPTQTYVTPEFIKQVFDARNAAKKSADDAKNWASTIDNSNFIKKTGEENQSINGSLDVKVLTEEGKRVYSPNNKPDADAVGALPATRSVVNGTPIYSVGDDISFEKVPTVNGKTVITDLTDVNNKINSINTNLNILNNRTYIVESYQNGNAWYQVYSNGYIEQSDAQYIETQSINAVSGTFINLLKPMKSYTYGISVDKINSGPWAQTEFAYAEVYPNGFWLASYTSSIPGAVLVRWTVRGY